MFQWLTWSHLGRILTPSGMGADVENSLFLDSYYLFISQQKWGHPGKINNITFIMQ